MEFTKGVPHNLLIDFSLSKRTHLVKAPGTPFPLAWAAVMIMRWKRWWKAGCWPEIELGPVCTCLHWGPELILIYLETTRVRRPCSMWTCFGRNHNSWSFFILNSLSNYQFLIVDGLIACTLKPGTTQVKHRNWAPAAPEKSILITQKLLRFYQDAHNCNWYS